MSGPKQDWTPYCKMGVPIPCCTAFFKVLQNYRCYTLFWPLQGNGYRNFFGCLQVSRCLEAKIYTQILREGVPHKHLEGSLVYMYFLLFP